MSSDVRKEKETLLIVDGRECAIFMIKDFNSKLNLSSTFVNHVNNQQSMASRLRQTNVYHSERSTAPIMHLWVLIVTKLLLTIRVTGLPFAKQSIPMSTIFNMLLRMRSSLNAMVVSL